MSVTERCPLYGGIIFRHTVFLDDNICPLFGGVRGVLLFEVDTAIRP